MPFKNENLTWAVFLFSLVWWLRLFFLLLFCCTSLEEMEKVAELSVSYFIGALSHSFFLFILCWLDILSSESD